MALTPTTYNTGNPVPSNDARDLDDSSKFIDTIANDQTVSAVIDRLGNSRDSLSKLEAQYIISPLNGGVWAVGIEFTARNQYMYYNSVPYKIKPSQPLPYTTVNADATLDAGVEPFNLGLNEQEVEEKVAELTNLVFETLTDAINSPLIVAGGSVSLKERVAGNGGGSSWDVVLTSSVTPNTHDIVQSVADPSLSLSLILSDTVSVNSLGPVTDMAAVQRANDIAGKRQLHFESVYDITSAVTITVKIKDSLQQIFTIASGSNLTIQNQEVRPEWFGDAQGAVRAAIDSLPSEGGVVKLEQFRYKPSDMTTPITKPNLKIKGAKKPWFSSNCDRLEGGSVIEGRFAVSADNFSHSDVGYDNGEFVRQTYFPAFTGDTNDYPLGGGTWDAFALVQIDTITTPIQRQGYSAENITGLCIKSSTVGHALLQESFDDGYLSNCHGMYSLHPFVIKGNIVRGGDLFGYGGGEEHFNLKADSYAACNDVALTSVTTDLQPEGTTPHGAPVVPAYGVYTFSSTADVTNIRLGTVKAWGAVQGVGESGGGVDNFIDGFHMEHLDINGRNYPGASGLMCSSDIKHYNYTVGTAKISNVADAVAFKNQISAGFFENAAMKIGTLIVTNASLRGLNAVSYGQIIVDAYITRGTVANKYACDDTARLRIGMSRDEGAVTNQYYLNPISLAAGWQQYAAQSEFKIDLKNYGVVAKGLLQPIGAGVAICNLPVYLRPSDSRRIPCVFATGVSSGETIAVASPAPGSADLNLVSDPGGSIAWLSLDGVYWELD